MRATSTTPFIRNRQVNSRVYLRKVKSGGTAYLPRHLKKNACLYWLPEFPMNQLAPASQTPQKMSAAGTNLCEGELLYSLELSGMNTNPCKSEYICRDVATS